MVSRGVRVYRLDPYCTEEDIECYAIFSYHGSAFSLRLNFIKKMVNGNLQGTASTVGGQHVIQALPHNFYYWPGQNKCVFFRIAALRRDVVSTVAYSTASNAIHEERV